VWEKEKQTDPHTNDFVATQTPPSLIYFGFSRACVFYILTPILAGSLLASLHMSLASNAHEVGCLIDRLQG